jgi:hypothetical protein
MQSRTHLILGSLAALGLACGSEPDVASGPPAAELALEVAGTYQVSGVTVEIDSRLERHIAGTLIMTRSGSEYRSSFELSTMLPSPDGPLHTQVIGNGEGEIDADGVLRGSARTQLVIGAVAGVPTQFPFVPRFVGPRIVSETVIVFGENGAIEIEIQTRADEGERYRATRTTLAGTLVPGSETAPAPMP